MAHLIDKDAVVADIERRIKEIDEIGTYLNPKGVLKNLLCHLNTLEVKDVDLVIGEDFNNSINMCSTEELKAELKRRTELAKAQKEEEMKNAAKCRNCKHLMNHPQVKRMYLCGARTWGKTYTRHYCVKLFNSCEKFERKE